MSPLDRLFYKWQQEDNEDSTKALATSVVKKERKLENLPESQRRKVETIIDERKRALDQTIMWS